MNSSPKDSLVSSVRVDGVPGLEWDVLRLDTLHPVVSGNKLFKLRPWLDMAEQQQKKGIVTFGGPWSNHIVATAYAARERSLASVGILRGDASARPTVMMEEAAGYGMAFRFLDRTSFRAARGAGFHGFIPEYPDHLIVPEGGAGEPGIRGAGSILEMTDSSCYSHIACACGTGTMMAGLVRSAATAQMVIGFDMVGQGDALNKLIRNSLPADTPPAWAVMQGYERGGYARRDPDLMHFINTFWAEQGIPSDIVYTGKLFMALASMAQEGFFPRGSRLLAIHSGGLQGNRSLPPGAISF